MRKCTDVLGDVSTPLASKMPPCLSLAGLQRLLRHRWYHATGHSICCLQTTHVVLRYAFHHQPVCMHCLTHLPTACLCAQCTMTPVCREVLPPYGTTHAALRHPAHLVSNITVRRYNCSHLHIFAPAQVHHKHAERRALVAEMCGALAPLLAPDMRPSLILSILQQMSTDTDAIVRQATVRSLATLLPLLPDVTKYSAVRLFLAYNCLDVSGLRTSQLGTDLHMTCNH